MRKTESSEIPSRLDAGSSNITTRMFLAEPFEARDIETSSCTGKDSAMDPRKNYLDTLSFYERIS
jgi:hypothetical protein